MIIITVEIPVMELQYDFHIDEDVPMFIVRNEIADKVCRKNQCSINGELNKLLCWDKKRRIFLDMNRTGFENGLETGSVMVLA